MSNSSNPSINLNHSNTLTEAIWQTNKKTHTFAKNAVLAIAGSIAIWVSAKVQIPFFPVPLTLQTMVILAIGMAYGWKLGMTTVLLYLVEGAMGLPVFAGTPAKGIGLAYMLGSTAGYLAGFVVSAGVVGWLAEKGWDRNPLKTAMAMIVGNIVIYFFGILWLGMLVGWDQPVFQWGIIPFIPGDLVKIGLAAVMMPTIWKLIGAKK